MSEMGITDDQLPDDLVPSDDNPLAQDLDPEESHLDDDDLADLMGDGDDDADADSDDDLGGADDFSADADDDLED